MDMAICDSIWLCRNSYFRASRLDGTGSNFSHMDAFLHLALLVWETNVSCYNFQLKSLFYVKYVICIISVNVYMECIIRINKVYHTNDIPCYI